MLFIDLLTSSFSTFSYAASAPPAIPANFPAHVSGAAPSASTSPASPGSLTFAALAVASDFPMPFSHSNLIILTFMQFFYICIS